ncbi:MAG: hypothetical protein J6W12_04250 [Bacteroidales bacterium]|nr:hypothetical protein [Bacteroidales bacterium]
MKKILFAIAIIMMLGMTANAQRDGFFGTYDNYGGDRETYQDLAAPNHGNGGYASGNGDAPLGTGLFILTALGAGYAVARKKR